MSNLETKVETLTATNALMKEDLSISKASLYRAQEENKHLLAQLSVSNSALPPASLGKAQATKEEVRNAFISAIRLRLT